MRERKHKCAGYWSSRIDVAVQLDDWLDSEPDHYTSPYMSFVGAI